MEGERGIYVDVGASLSWPTVNEVGEFCSMTTKKVLNLGEQLEPLTRRSES